MAQLIQRKLRALHCHCLLSAPFRASSSLNSTGARQLACRWYGEAVLLEDLCSSSQSASEIDGNSVAASQGGKKSCRRNEGAKEEASKEKLNGSNSEVASESVSFKSLMEKLTSSVSETSKSKANLTANQGRMEAQAQVFEKSSALSDQSSEIDDDKSGESGNRSEQTSGPSVLKELNSKHKNAQPHSSSQQKPKEANPSSFSFMKALDTKGTPTRSENDSTFRSKPQGSLFQGVNQRSLDATPGRVDNKLARGPGSTPLRSPAMKGSPGADMQGRSTSSIDESTRSSTGYMVRVHNLPVNSNPAKVKAAMSTYGEVAGIFKRSSREDSLSVFVKYKTAEGMEAALAGGRRLQSDCRTYNIARAEMPFATVVRLNRVSQETSHNQLLSICERYGGLDNIRKRGSGTYDIYYKVEELPNMSNILGSLNEVTFNRSAWIAVSAPILHPAVKKEVLKSREGQAWHENQANQALARIEGGLDLVSVLFEDLKELVALGKECFDR